MLKRRIYFIWLALGLGLTVCGSGQAVVMEGSLIVTDVTPVQFCVVWATSEPASGSLKVFLDPEATTSYPQAVVTFESADQPPADDIGIMKVKVMGLKPDTEYFFQTETIAKNPADTTVYLYPNNPPLIKVRTEKASIPVPNDVIALKAGIGDDKPALGMLVVASIVDKASNPITSYPVTGWVGDGVPDEWVLIDTNNFYDKNTGENLQLAGGEDIHLMLFGGLLGSAETQDTVPDPEETDGIQALKAAALLPDAGDEPSAPISQETESGGGGGGGTCFITSAAF